MPIRKPPYDPNAHRYPKMIYPEGSRKGIQVANKAEHDALLAKHKPAEKPVEKIEHLKEEPKQEVSQSRADMIAYAEAHNIKIDKRWGDDKLAQAIADAKGIAA